MNIGEKIRQLRLEKGLTQKELGDALGSTQQMIAQYESGKHAPKVSTLRRIAAALGVGLDAFLDLDLGGADKLVRPAQDMVDNLLGDILRTRQEAEDWKERLLLEQFYKLNDEGQTKAVEDVENLTYNPKFSKNQK